MKDKFLKMAGVKSEKEFYKKYPTEEAFFKANPSALKMMQTGGGLQDQQIFQYPNYDQNMMAYAQRAQEDEQNNPMGAITNMFKTGAMAAGKGLDNALANGEDGGNKMQMAKLAMNVMGMPAMQMGGVGMMMRDNYYDEGGEMAMGQVMAMNDKIARLQNFINGESEIEPWVASKLTLADDYLTSVSDYLQFNEGNEGEEEEEDTELTMGEMQEMKMGGIPQRYKSRGFTKVGAKRNSDRAGKKWMVLAKKGDKYKIVHGGYVGMKDFSQHGSNKRKNNFWNRMGGKDSAKAKDPFSPLYWHKRFGTWAYGGDISDAPINTSMSPGVGNDPRFEQYYNQQLQNLSNAGVRNVKSMPSRDDIYSYYQSSSPQSAVDQTGRMMFSNPKGTISTGTTYSQAVDPNTGQVINQGTNLQKTAFDKEAERFNYGGKPTNAGFQALPEYVQNKILSNMAYGGDMYGGQMDMDSMYQMMKGGGSTNSGDAWYQQGGQGEDQVMQAIQMYAQMTQTDPEQIIMQLKAMPPQEQQQAIQQIMQAIQQQQSQSPDSMAYGGININSANFARNGRSLKKQMGGMTQGSELELHPEEIQNLIDQGYGIEYLD
jgi:hypothetical protein